MNDLASGPLAPSYSGVEASASLLICAAFGFLGLLQGTTLQRHPLQH